MSRTFPSKLLLFGEHILLKSAPALAAPAPAWSGRWEQSTAVPPPPQWEQLRHLTPLLEQSGVPLRLADLRRDVEAGWYFPSNIPQGYGLGSSGALCAGLLERYGDIPPDHESARAVLSQIEGCFHGKSSGIDPLTSWVQRPLLVKGSHITVLEQYTPPSDVTVFLADTQSPRQTGRLVQWFLEQWDQNSAFRTHLEEELLPAHQHLLSAWLSGDSTGFMDQLQQISRWQWQWMLPMRPVHEGIARWWTAAADTGHTRLKICGGGGGGLTLGFTTRPDDVREYASVHDIQIIFPFAA